MALGPGPRQGELFGGQGPGSAAGAGQAPSLPMLEHQLRQWQQRLLDYQQPLFLEAAQQRDVPTGQGQLFSSPATAAADLPGLDPLALTAQHLQFWRWPQSQQQGPALYFVIDRPPHLEGPQLLYVGETGQADRRWKGDHDCKGYLAAYGDALQGAGLGSQLSIRFWSDAPQAVRGRRALEQALIRHWLPPFNKETRGRWATPFTAESDR